jgi:hypothetical protein
MAHFVKCLIKIHNQAIGLSAYIQVVSDVIDKLHQLGITQDYLKLSTWTKPIPVLYQWHARKHQIYS